MKFLFLESRRLAETAETLRSRHPAKIGLVSFLDLPPCENVQKVQK
jgi:hypothetical protein